MSGELCQLELGLDCTCRRGSEDRKAHGIGFQTLLTGTYFSKGFLCFLGFHSRVCTCSLEAPLVGHICVWAGTRSAKETILLLPIRDT